MREPDYENINNGGRGFRFWVHEEVISFVVYYGEDGAGRIGFSVPKAKMQELLNAEVKA